MNHKKTYRNGISILLFILFCVVFGAKQSYAAGGSDISMATQVSMKGKQIKDKINTKNMNRYYKIKLNKSGKVVIKVTSQVSESLNIKLYDERKSEIAETVCAYDNQTKTYKDTITYYLGKGTYYLRFSTAVYGAKGIFYFTPSVTYFTTNDKEPNNSIDEAQKIVMNNIKTGLISSTDQKDTYKISIKKTGILNVVVSSNVKDAVRVEVSREDGAYSKNREIKYKKSFLYNKKVKAGTYYISIETDSMKHSGKYKLKVNNVRAIKKISVSETKKTLNVGKSFTLLPNKSPANATEGVVYSSSKKSVATVSKKGKIVALKPGKTIIKIKSVDGRKTASCTVTVKKIQIQKIKMSDSQRIQVGKYVTLKPTILPANASSKKIIWSSSKKNVATVDTKGEVKAIGVGNCVITAKDASSNVKAICEITVYESVVETQTPSPVIEIESIQINNSISLGVGDKSYINVVYSPSNATEKKLTWSSSDLSVVKVDSSGIITGISKGTAIVTVIAPSGKKAYCSVLVR